MSSFLELAQEYSLYILDGAWVTVQITVSALLVSVAIAIPITFLRLSGVGPLSWIASAYVEVIRGTPALLQLFLIYFGLANLGLRLEAFPAAVLALGIMGGAYLIEVFRAGVEGVDTGQTEAGKALGMNGVQVMRRVVAPQAFRLVLPQFTNFVVQLVKETSLVLTIAVPEIMYRAYSVAGITYRDMEVYAMAGVTYLIICFPIGRLARALEKRAARSRR